MEIDKNEQELKPILKDETNKKKKPRQVNWGYKHFLVHNDPNFHKEKEEIEEFVKETRGSNLSKRKSYLRDLKSNLKDGLSSKPFQLEEADVEPASPFSKKKGHEEVIGFSFGSSPGIEDSNNKAVENQFGFPSLEKKDEEAEEDEVEFEFAFPKSPLPRSKKISPFGAPFGEQELPSLQKKDSNDMFLRSTESIELDVLEDFPEFAGKRRRRASFHERDFESLDIGRRDARRERARNQRVRKKSSSPQPSSLMAKRKKRNRLIENMLSNSRFDERSSNENSMEEAGILQIQSLKKTLSRTDLHMNEDPNQVSPNRYIPLGIKKAKSLDFRVRRTIDLVKQFRSDIKNREDTKKNELKLLKVMVARLLVFGEDETHLDFSDDFENFYDYNKAALGILIKYCDLSSTFSAFSESKRNTITVSEFKEGCSYNPDQSAFAFAFEVFLRQSFNLKTLILPEELSSPISPIEKGKNSELIISGKRMKKYGCFRYFWKALNGSFEFRDLKIKSKYSGVSLYSIHCSISTRNNQLINIWLIKNPKTERFVVSSFSCFWVDRKGETSEISILGKRVGAQTLLSLFQITNLTKDLWELLRRIGLMAKHLKAGKRILDRHRSLWESVIKEYVIEDNFVRAHMLIEGKTEAEIKIFVRFSKIDLGWGIQIIDVKSDPDGEASKKLKEAVKLFNTEAYDLESFLSKMSG